MKDSNGHINLNNKLRQKLRQGEKQVPQDLLDSTFTSSMTALENSFGGASSSFPENGTVPVSNGKAFIISKLFKPWIIFTVGFVSGLFTMNVYTRYTENQELEEHIDDQEESFSVVIKDTTNESGVLNKDKKEATQKDSEELKVDKADMPNKKVSTETTNKPYSLSPKTPILSKEELLDTAYGAGQNLSDTSTNTTENNIESQDSNLVNEIEPINDEKQSIKKTGLDEFIKEFKETHKDEGQELFKKD